MRAEGFEPAAGSDGVVALGPGCLFMVVLGSAGLPPEDWASADVAPRVMARAAKTGRALVMIIPFLVCGFIPPGRKPTPCSSVPIIADAALTRSASSARLRAVLRRLCSRAGQCGASCKLRLGALQVVEHRDHLARQRRLVRLIDALQAHAEGSNHFRTEISFHYSRLRRAALLPKHTKSQPFSPSAVPLETVTDRYFRPARSRPGEDLVLTPHSTWKGASCSRWVTMIGIRRFRAFRRTS